MSPLVLFRLWKAETDKLLSRFTARLGLVLAVLLGFVGPIGLWWVGTSDAVFNAKALSEMWTETAPLAQEWSLSVRNNLYFMRIMLTLLGAMSFAGEYRAHTLREDLLRPVPRWVVPLVKWLALVNWLALTLIITWAVSTVMGIAIFGFGGPWFEAFTGYLATLGTDAGFAALVLLVAVAFRSVAGAIGGVMLYAVIDTLMAWGLDTLAWGLTNLAKIGAFQDLPSLVELVMTVRPWLPSSAYSCWAGYNDEWVWQSMVTLTLLTVCCLGLSKVIASYVDVP
ncbi:MAG: ABC transporter permease subunit [Proteobacteria bacterium]|nr:ABC transporter permease subunit [Pseudomonadota bacterium]